MRRSKKARKARKNRMAYLYKRRRVKKTIPLNKAEA